MMILTREEQEERRKRAAREHKAMCDQPLTMAMHLDGDKWFGTEYRCSRGHSVYVQDPRSRGDMMSSDGKPGSAKFRALSTSWWTDEENA